MGGIRIATCFYSKFRQQRLRVLQIRRVKPFGEPPIDRSEQVIGLLALVLTLPQLCEAHGSAEFEGFGVLRAGDVEGLMEAGFSLDSVTWVANRDRGAETGYSAGDLKKFNIDAIELIASVRNEKGDLPMRAPCAPIGRGGHSYHTR